MLENIVHNSGRLIKSQYDDQNSLLNQLIKRKTNKKNLSFFQTSQTASIFVQPEFNHHLDLKSINKRNRAYMTSQNFTHRSKSASKTLQKIQTRVKSKPLEEQNFIIDDEYKFNDTKKSKIIHSFRNVDYLQGPKNSKIHHQKVYKAKQKFSMKNSLIQQPGLTNLCFYKNSLQEINVMRSARITIRRKNQQSNLSSREKSNKTKIIFTNKNNMNDKNPDCRPWSPKNDNDSVQGELLCFKSLSLKI